MNVGRYLCRQLNMGDHVPEGSDARMLRLHRQLDGAFSVLSVLQQCSGPHYNEVAAKSLKADLRRAAADLVMGLTGVEIEDYLKQEMK